MSPDTAGAASATGAAVEYQTFPVGSCDGALPSSPLVYEVAVHELKELRLTVDGLPYPIVASEGTISPTGGDWSFSHGAGPGHALGSKGTQAQPVRLVDVFGGVPMGRALDVSLDDLAKPAYRDLPVGNVDALLRTDGPPVVRVDGRDVTMTLDSATRRSLANGLPVVVTLPGDDHGTDNGTGTGAGATALRLLPGQGAHVPPVYRVDDPAEFIANPGVVSMEGVVLPVQLDEAQVRDLRTTGATTVEVSGVPVAVTSSAGVGTSAQAQLMSDPQKTPGNSGASATTTTTGADTPRPVDDLESQEIALFLAWKQTWRLLGYSRGQLLQSLTLAPQEETTIEISSWDRRKRTTEETSDVDVEQTQEFTDTTKDVSDVLNELKNDNQFSVDTKFGVGVTVKDVVSLRGDSDSGYKSSLALSSKSSVEHMREAVLKAGTKLKIERQTKVGETVEIGREEKVTRHVRNPNMCHALTLNYFETLAHYSVTTELDVPSARLCLLLAGPYGRSFAFTKYNVRQYEGILRRVLMQPELAAGFAAAHKLVAVDQIGAAQALLRAELPPAGGDKDGPTTKALDEVKAAVTSVIGDFSLLTAAAMSKIPSGSDWNDVYARIQATPETARRRTIYRRRLGELAPGLVSSLSALAGVTTPTEADVRVLNRAIADVTSLEQISRDRMNQPGPEEHRLYELARVEFQVPTGYWNPGAPFLHVDDAGLVGALRLFQTAFGQWVKAQAEQTGPQGRTAGAVTSYTTKEVAEALEQLDALLSHLNQYSTYYRSALIRLMPLDDSLLVRLEGQPLVAERRILTDAGGRVAVPLRADSDPRLVKLFASLVGDNSQLKGVTDTFTLTLPTPGVTIEPWLGACNACEDYVQSLRSLELESRTADRDLKRERLVHEQLETKRYEKRLGSDDLSDPETRGTLQVGLDDATITAIGAALKPTTPT